MSRRSRQQLSADFSSSIWQERFVAAYSVKELLTNCIVRAGYDPPPEMLGAVRLTEAGQAARDELQRRHEGLENELATFAVFLVFAHRDLLVDIEATNVDAIKASLASEMSLGRTIFPWQYGRVLYERHHELGFGEINVLDHEATMRLLADQPQGVFQLGRTLVGPLGVLEAAYPRLLPVPERTPLWSCSDVSCSTVHSVRLTTGESPVAEAANEVLQEMYTAGGQGSEWAAFFRDLLVGDRQYDDMNTESLPWLIANSFSDDERLHLLTELLEDREGPREFLASASGIETRFRGPVAEIIRVLNPPEALQALLLGSDELLIRHLDRCISDQHLMVPKTEVRVPRPARLNGGWFRAVAQCSVLGVRLHPRGKDSSIARLRAFIAMAYRDDASMRDLDWRLRHFSGNDPMDRLDRCLATKDPREVLRDLVLTSPATLEAMFGFLRFGSFQLPSTRDDEERLLDVILWKLGFQTLTYPENWSLLRSRLDAFRAAGNAASPGLEETIRAAGANFFVSLEEALDAALSFTSWAVCSDHVADTTFMYMLAPARRLMAELLNSGGPVAAGDVELIFDPNGRNALYVLTEGFGRLATFLEDLMRREPDYARQQSGLPAFALSSRIASFPFLHRMLLFDLGREDVAQLIIRLRTTTDALRRANVSNIRNRIDHNRGDFPTSEEIDALADAMVQVIDDLEDSGLLPSVRYPVSTRTDQYGRRVVALADYRATTLEVSGSSQIDQYPWPAAAGPLVVVPSLKLKNTAEMIRFRFQEPSPFVEMWAGFPIRQGASQDSSRSRDDAAVEIGSDLIEVTETPAP